MFWYSPIHLARVQRTSQTVDAILHGDVAKVRDLLNKGINPNCLPTHGPTIKLAIRNKQLRVIMPFLQAGADPDAGGYVTAIEEAVRRKIPEKQLMEVITLLTSAGSRPWPAGGPFQISLEGALGVFLKDLMDDQGQIARLSLQQRCYLSLLVHDQDLSMLPPIIPFIFKKWLKSKVWPAGWVIRQKISLYCRQCKTFDPTDIRIIRSEWMKWLYT